MAATSIVNVVVSGAAGQVAYSLLPLLCSGRVLGPDQRIHLRLLDIPQSLEVLSGVVMELNDCAFHLVHEIVPTTDLQTAFQDADIAILLGGFPRKQGMERKELISKNGSIFKAQGEALELYARKSVKVLVVANPANTNCLIAMKHAPSIPTENFSALTRLDHERMRSLLVKKIQSYPEHKHVSSQHLKNCVIWGNHSNTQVPDAAHVVIQMADGSVAPLADFLQDPDWIDSSLRPLVQNRGAAIIQARKLSSAMSVAAAIAGHMNDWLFGTSELVSMAVLSTGNKYDVPDDLIYSFPVKCIGNGKYQLANVAVTPAIAKLMQLSADELEGEKVEAFAHVESNC
ncbi:hypothetical protein H310_13626 [Aphanomyces invadans]|uniref:malate dehydrogenase n=1 Tax=Aphanomyces invadans TaxID=157072 RepID=A0A024TDC3_9STRA|nr:hypothetical protein H310_13626 [Aphanomyces invadans]ETV91989.1 hypothetical protein H310_13626 [Aphanomyces invadans]|eukprot:XP_008879413.1 hypothetical protein H310_13626 [Aphanomyces invadans]